MCPSIRTPTGRIMNNEKIIVEYVRVSKNDTIAQEVKVTVFDRLKDAVAWIESLKSLDRGATFDRFQIKQA